ncbi:MAG: gamma-glutamylcyclotransferase [Clostridiales bacterium]|jgi:cation transport regulator ChaC|nr:gamma-glutamylcyclotransferase [Clostridiales bacterium]
MKKPKATEIYYFAYGSNCNLRQMAVRCPKATVTGTVTLKGYTLEFNRVASIRRKKGGEVKGVLWLITPECEKSLDRYEGYPNYYTKKNVNVCYESGEMVKAMVYIMTPENSNPAYPSEIYFNGIRDGFVQNGLEAETETLYDAYYDVKRRLKRLEKAGVV